MAILPWVTERKAHIETMSAHEHVAIHTDLQDRLGLDGSAEADQTVHTVPLTVAGTFQLQTTREVHNL